MSSENQYKIVYSFSDAFNKVIKYEDYTENCKIYDSTDIDPFDNLKSKIDVFVIYHIIGWIGKAFIYRNIYVAIIASQFFEVLEYVSKHHNHQNFAECWWDSVIIYNFYM